MKKSIPVISVILVFMMAAPAIVSARQLSKSRAELIAAESSYEALVQDGSEVLALRSRQPMINTAERPAQDVIAHINTVLAAVGIPGNRLKSLTPEADVALPTNTGATPHKKQSLRLTLDGLTIQEIGSFLLQWKASQQVWTCSRIELTHARSTNSKIGDSDNRYDATILLTAVYLAPTPPPTQPNPAPGPPHAHASSR